MSASEGAPGTPPVIGIIGGSGVYEIDGLESAQWVAVASPWGRPSDELLVGRLDGQRCVFLPRHGRGHRIPPSELNSRANIDVLKRMGVTEVISLSACGSLREDLPPGTFVIVDQFIDRSFAQGQELLRRGTGRACDARPSGLRPARRRTGADVPRAGAFPRRAAAPTW